jgi:dCMP deaminase
MVSEDRKITLGITGSFGSGCSTLAAALNEQGYERITLSAAIKTEWANLHAGTTPSRKDLQDLGDSLRQSKTPSYLAEVAAIEGQKLGGQVVFDGIRNQAEAQFLRETFPNFFLIAVWCPQPERWKRIQSEYDGSQSDFLADDERDKDEELQYGQQVQLCVDNADIVISNETAHNSKPVAIRALKTKIAEYLSLLNGSSLRTPTQAEAAMAVAYTYSLRSLCIKRQVGAVIADTNGRVISVGYNENPDPVAPCIKQFTACYKDDWLHQHLEMQLQKNGSKCYKCQESIPSIAALGQTYKCPKCKTSFIRMYAPDRGMSRCTAIHAENMAIMNAAGRNLENTILYTTTFPCAQCARQLVYAGIKEVVYVEPYPDPDSVRFLRELSDRRVRLFEGVKARAYDRVFSRVREQHEKTYALNK